MLLLDKFIVVKRTICDGVASRARLRGIEVEGQEA